MKEVKTPKKPLVFYYMIALVVLLIFNLIVISEAILRLRVPPTRRKR